MVGIEYNAPRLRQAIQQCSNDTRLVDLEISMMEKAIAECQEKLINKNRRQASEIIKNSLTVSQTIRNTEEIETSFTAKQIKFQNYLELSNIEAQNKKILESLLKKFEIDQNNLEIPSEFSGERQELIEKINKVKKELSVVEGEIQKYLISVKTVEPIGNGDVYLKILMVVVGISIALGVPQLFFKLNML